MTREDTETARPWPVPDVPWRLLAAVLVVLLLSLSRSWHRAAELRTLDTLHGTALVPADVRELLPLDDAYIYQVYGRTLARGGGYGFRSGRTDGAATSHVWALLVALPHLAFPQLPFDATRWLGLCCLLLACLLTGELVRTASDSPFAGALAAVLTATIPRAHWAAMAGMDPPVTMALLAAGTWLVLERRPLLGTTLLGLTAFARPECLVVLPFLALARWLHPTPDRTRLRACLPALIAFVVTLAAFAGWHLALSGAFLPSAFAAKLTPDEFPSPAEFLFRLTLFLEQDHALLAPLVLVLALRLPLSSRSGEHGWLAAFAGSIVLGLPLAKSLLAPSFNDLLFQHGRQVIPVSLAATWLIGLAAARLGTSSRGRPWVALACLASPALYALWLFAPPGDPVAFLQALLTRFREELLLPSFVLASAIVLVITRRASPARMRVHLGAFLLLSISADLVRLRSEVATYENELAMTGAQNVRCATWLREHTAQEAVIGVNDLGALGYYAERELIDLFGLIDPWILESRRQDPEAPRPAGVATDLAPTFLETRPLDVLAIYPEWFPGLLGDLRQGVRTRTHTYRLPDLHPTFQAQVPNNPTTGGSIMAVYEVITTANE